MPIPSSNEYRLAGYEALIKELRSLAKDWSTPHYGRSVTEENENVERKACGEILGDLINSYLGEDED